jgi:hypothetical protein
MITYLQEEHKYSFSYKEVKEAYTEFVNLNDKDFLKNLPRAAHLACVICFFKEIPTDLCLNDTGIVHQLVHLMDIKDYHKKELREIRKNFEEVLKLA